MFRRIRQFDELWRCSALRMMENSFDNAHFAFVHKGTFGDIDQPKPEKYELTETHYGFVAETIVPVRNPPQAARITGTSEPWTKRKMRNAWFMPFCRTMDMEYPSGLRHVIFNSATPVDDLPRPISLGLNISSCWTGRCLSSLGLMGLRSIALIAADSLFPTDPARTRD